MTVRRQEHLHAAKDEWMTIDRIGDGSGPAAGGTHKQKAQFALHWTGLAAGYIPRPLQTGENQQPGAAALDVCAQLALVRQDAYVPSAHHIATSEKQLRPHPMTNTLQHRTFEGMHLITPASLTPFARVQAWIFDLDNTLYPSECNLFAQVDQRMGSFIAALRGSRLGSFRLH